MKERCPCAVPGGSCCGIRAPGRGCPGPEGPPGVPEPCPAPGGCSPGLHIPALLIPSLHNLGSASWAQHLRPSHLNIPHLGIPHLCSPHPNLQRPGSFTAQISNISGVHVLSLQHPWLSIPVFHSPGSLHANLSPIPDLSTVSSSLLSHTLGLHLPSQDLWGLHPPGVPIPGCCIPEKQGHNRPFWVGGQTGRGATPAAQPLEPQPCPSAPHSFCPIVRGLSSGG